MIPAQIASLADIKALPKLELHIHLEGTISPERVAMLAAQQGLELPRPLAELYQTDDLSAFLETLDWVCSLIRDTASIALIADDFGRYCRDQHIVYAEVIVNPTHWSGLGFEQLLPALSDAFDLVQQNYGVDVRLLPSILRQQSSDDALDLVQWMGQAQCARIIGLSIDGNEATAGRTAARFRPAYELAKTLGFGCTAHAGESSGAEGVRDAVHVLQADRIDHGIRVIEDPVFTDYIVSKRITLNVCLSSNCRLIYGAIENHPFKDLQRAGVNMTLNTDDPAVLNTSLCDELFWAAQQLPLSLADLRQFQLNAVNAAFCDSATKNSLVQQLSTAE